MTVATKGKGVAVQDGDGTVGEIKKARWAGSRCGRCGFVIWDGDMIRCVRGSKSVHASIEACSQAKQWAEDALALESRRGTASGEQRRANLKRTGQLLAQQDWIFAKTMPLNPHHYTLRRRWARDEDFVWVVEQIRLQGYQQKYGRSKYTVLDIGSDFYWTMGAPIPITILINRKPLATGSRQGAMHEELP